MTKHIRRALIVICIAAGLAGLASGQGETRNEVYLIDFNDVVHGVSADYVIEGIQEANAARAELILIRMQTPGGMVNAMERIIQAILASERPVVAFVSPRGAKAASAGFYILMACDVAAMAPGTRTGAATPVLLSGESDNESFRTLLEKARRDSGAFLRTLVRGRHRNPDVPMEETTVPRAMAAIEESEAYTEREALRYGLIDFTAESVDEILERLDGRQIRRFAIEDEEPEVVTVSTAGATIVPVEMDLRQQFLSYLSNPMIALLLGTIGVIGLYIEFTNPGLILPGAVGVICLVLASIAFQVLPVNWAGLLLIGIAIFLFVLEFKIASFGLLTLGGIVCMIFGALMLFEGPIPEMRLSIWQAVPFTAAFALIALFLLRLVVRAHLRKVETGKQGIVGERGEIRGGKAFVHGELWSLADAAGFEEGDAFVVEAVDRMKLRVKKA